MKLIYAGLLGVVLAFLSVASASTKITVNGMVCAFCAQGIEKSLSKIPEVKAVFVDLKYKVVVVESIDGVALNDKLITQGITDAGYDVIKIENIPQTISQFRSEQRSKK